MNKLSFSKRKILAAVILVGITFILGLIISSKIYEAQVDRNEMYNKAVKIDQTELFQYGMRTNVGNAFVYGTLKTIDPVTYSEIGGSYMYVQKVKEEYTRHTRQVAHTRTVNGKSTTYYTTEVYWTWDAVSRENKQSKQLSFLNVIFESSKFNFPETSYIDTINKSHYVRYVYSGTKSEYIGTIFTSLQNNTIRNNTSISINSTISQTVDRLESDNDVAIFWIIWIFIMAGGVLAMFYFELPWLEK